MGSSRGDEVHQTFIGLLPGGQHAVAAVGQTEAAAWNSMLFGSSHTAAVGRKSREVFDDVWTQLQRIGNPARSVQTSDRIT